MDDQETVLTTAEDITEPVDVAGDDQTAELSPEDQAQAQAEGLFDGKGSDEDAAAKAEEAEAEADQEQDAKSDAESDEKQDAPDDYEAFTLPEGVEMDDSALDKFKPIAKEAGLDQANAQKFVDLYTEAVIEATESQQKMWADTQQTWVDQAKADPEIGGDKFENNLGDAKRAIKQFGTPELDEAMAVTGAGNHPEFIRFMSRVGKAISEDSMVPGRATAGPKTPEEILYPSMGQD